MELRGHVTDGKMQVLPSGGVIGSLVTVLIILLRCEGTSTANYDGRIHAR